MIRDRAGQDWIIELNPRIAGSAIFSALAGCDLFAATLAVSEASTERLGHAASRVALLAGARGPPA